MKTTFVVTEQKRFTETAETPTYDSHYVIEPGEYPVNTYRNTDGSTFRKVVIPIEFYRSTGYGGERSEVWGDTVEIALNRLEAHRVGILVESDQEI
ncbi:hypothetical protein [Endozoicomonas sp. ALB032]|uniref:hypothetical protein n=1 Tax=Endozoicomonas sp. ALB032 TaxID=3403082 RepID=UPI003BB6D0B8